MIRKIPASTKYYEFYNANPKGKRAEDCGVRAVALALGVSWDEAIDLLVAKAHKYKDAPESDKCVRAVIEENGFVPMKVDVRFGNTRPTMCEVIEMYKGYVIVGAIAHHYMAATDGKVKDIWNSSERPLYKFWIKKIK